MKNIAETVAEATRTGIFIAAIWAATFLIAAKAAGQTCGGFCSALQTAYGNGALSGNGRRGELGLRSKCARR
jgi:hypothetical protein